MVMLPIPQPEFKMTCNELWIFRLFNTTNARLLPVQQPTASAIPRSMCRFDSFCMEYTNIQVDYDAFLQADAARTSLLTSTLRHFDRGSPAYAAMLRVLSKQAETSDPWSKVYGVARTLADGDMCEMRCCKRAAL
jgi:hypothetical protein